jgi:hypothetical protein
MVFWTFKVSFDVDILAFFSLVPILATFLKQKLAKSSGHPGPNFIKPSLSVI